MAEAQRDEIAKLEALYAANPEGHVFTHLAEAYRKAGELEHARDILAEGLRRHPDSASAHVVLGRVEHDRADHEAARLAFTRVLLLDAGNLVALRFLGELALERGERAEALGHFRELLTRDVTDPSLQQTVLDLTRDVEPAAPAPVAEPAAAASVEAATPETRVEPAPEVPATEFEPPTEPGAVEPAAETPPEVSAADLAAEESPAEGMPAEQRSEVPAAELAAQAPAEAPAPELAVEAPAEAPAPELTAETPAEVAGDDMALWEPGEPEFLAIEFDAAEAGEPGVPGFDVSAALEGVELEFLSIDEEEPPEAPGEFLVLEAPEYPIGPDDEVGALWGEAEGETALEDIFAETVGSFELLPELEPLDEPRPGTDETAETVPAEAGAAPEWAAELVAVPAEAAMEPVAAESEPVVLGEVAAEGAAEPEPQPAAEAELILAVAFEAPAEPIPQLDELTPLGDLAREPEPAPEEAAAGLFTETMAELYRRQGFPDRAAEVYRWLLTREPENGRLQQLLAEAEAAAAAGAPAAPAPAGREWLIDLQGVESAFTGGSGAEAGADTPYAWAGAEDAPVAGPAIGDYFREMLAWRPAAPATSFAEPPAATGSELLLDEVVPETAPWEEAPASPPAALPVEPPQDLMPWEFAEPPALAAEPVPEPDTPLPELATEPAAAHSPDEQGQPGEVEAEDEDLEMFRSWLQSLKK